MFYGGEHKMLNIHIIQQNINGFIEDANTYSVYFKTPLQLCSPVDYIANSNY